MIVFIFSHCTFDNNDMKSLKCHVTSHSSLIFLLQHIQTGITCFLKTNSCHVMSEYCSFPTSIIYNKWHNPYSAAATGKATTCFFFHKSRDTKQSNKLKLNSPIIYTSNLSCYSQTLKTTNCVSA